MRSSEWNRWRTAFVREAPERFDDGEVDGLPEPVVRYFRASVRTGTPLYRSVEISMRGRIRIGRWIPFRADEILAPHEGFVWAARAAGVVSGSDRYVDGEGSMAWRALGLVPVMNASGPDVSRSAALRAASEAVWVPTALLPRFGVTWSARGPTEIEAEFTIDQRPVRLTLALLADGLPRSVHLDRWGDPDGTGEFALHPFGADFTSWRSFAGLTVPSAGTVGWSHGTGEWGRGEFFRFTIDGHDPIDGA